MSKLLIIFKFFRCWEPTWLNGTQLLFWVIDTKSRHENFPCLDEKEEERKEIEQLKNAILTTTLLPPLPPIYTKTDESDQKLKLYHIIAIAGIVFLIIIIVSLIAFNKYRKYRPIYNVEKMSSPMHNEMKYMNGNSAEKAQLVSH